MFQRYDLPSLNWWEIRWRPYQSSVLRTLMKVGVDSWRCFLESQCLTFLVNKDICIESDYLPIYSIGPRRKLHFASGGCTR